MAFEGDFALDPDARRLRAAMTVPPPPGRLWQINQTIKQLKQHGIWQKLDVLWMLAAHDAQAARLNWKAPASFALTAVNSPTFTADRGYAGNGTTSYLNTGWDPGTNGVQFARDNASNFAWSRTSRAAAAMNLMGAFNSPYTTGISIENRFTGNLAYGRSNDSPLTGGLANTESSGLFHSDRQSNTARTLYRNAVSLGSYGSSPSGALVAADVVLLCASNGTPGVNFSTDQMTTAGLGASLNSEKDALYNILDAHLRAVGAA